MNALPESKSPIAEPAHELSEFDLVFIGTPVWAGVPAPAVNAYIERHRDALDHVAFFSTQGKFGASGALAGMEPRLAHLPLATLEVSEDDIGGSALDERIEAFLSDLQDARGRA